MQHLDTDRLAALADETPTAEEATHLASCLACRRERDAFVALLALAQRDGALVAAAADVGAPGSGAPLTTWEPIAASLRAEGLLRSSADGHAGGATTVHAFPATRTTARAGTFLRRAAASVALLVGGAALGRVTAPAAGASSAPPATQVASAERETPAPAAMPTSNVRPVSQGLSDSLPVWGEAGGRAGFGTVSDAMKALERAQREYQRAAAYLAEHDTGSVAGSPQILRARLAALDEVMPKVREALYEAPQDPVLNQYYMTTADVRESTLRQLGRALPVGVSLNGY